ncbi:hypothetical protein [Streptacidiphilus jiangxiensis]|jgi:hypothetical protein|uniref:Uncharacterized protein n=1 Tax=Streptacidiphilus jiangxiensis TaxID=235985 RepID=A0A1H7QZA9_STRJI|nr:hypothetical protein [Streptacidiphilus jiangxiensis]SEL53330.1 hypothetical protein SAMN05414137_109297 [Streptacidiphilus jiangxiensis]
MPSPTDEAASVRATPAPRPVDGNRLGETLATELRAALGRHGITLPSLHADHPLGNKPLIMLGRVNQDTAERLTALLDSIEPAKD